MTAWQRDLVAFAGLVSLAIAAFLLGVVLGFVIVGLELLAVAVMGSIGQAPQTVAPKESNDGS